MTSPRARFSLVVNGDKEIFVFPDIAGISNTVEIYDIASDEWTVLDVNVGWDVTAIKVSDGKIVWISARAPAPKYFMFDLDTREVTELPEIAPPDKLYQVCLVLALNSLVQLQHYA